jgi:hypothetical protein
VQHAAHGLDGCVVAAFLSPRPIHREAAIAAASVVRTSSRARLRSTAVVMGREGTRCVLRRDDPTLRTVGAWQDAGVSSLWCFQCGAEYQEGVETCAECGVGLVPEAPLAPEDVGSSDEEQLAYELHDWSFESRRMLDQLLTVRGWPIRGRARR